VKLSAFGQWRTTRGSDEISIQIARNGGRLRSSYEAEGTTYCASAGRRNFPSSTIHITFNHIVMFLLLLGLILLRSLATSRLSAMTTASIAQTTTSCPFYAELSLCATTQTSMKPQSSTCYTATQTLSTGNCQPAKKGCQRNCPLIPLVTTTLPAPNSDCPHTPTLTNFVSCSGDPCSAPCPKSMLVTVTGGTAS
jgi:hypothetical protein